MHLGAPEDPVRGPPATTLSDQASDKAASLRATSRRGNRGPSAPSFDPLVLDFAVPGVGIFDARAVGAIKLQ